MRFQYVYIGDCEEKEWDSHHRLEIKHNYSRNFARTRDWIGIDFATEEKLLHEGIRRSMLHAFLQNGRRDAT